MKKALLSHGILTTRHCRLVALGMLLAASSTASSNQWQSLTSIAQTALKHARSSMTSSESRVESSVKSLDSRLKLARCDQPLQGFTPQNNGTPRQNVVIGVRCRGSNPWKVYVPVKLSVFRQVLVTQRPLNRGSLITAADVRSEERDVASLHAAYLTDIGQLQGKVLKRSVPEGRLVTIDLLNQEELIKRGQQVTLVVKQNGFVVRMAGTALSDGVINERIRVENKSSRRRVEGVVRSQQLVEVITY